MTIRYSNKPVLNYGDPPPANNWEARFPARAEPMETAPMDGKPKWVFEPSGKYYAALLHRGQWMKLEPQKDPYTGATRMQMSGEAVNNPIRWCSS